DQDHEETSPPFPLFIMDLTIHNLDDQMALQDLPPTLQKDFTPSQIPLPVGEETNLNLLPPGDLPISLTEEKYLNLTL
ncbi:hypothetical protein FQN50_000958, partial [Emmonsiellopsis sp. PD_5]